MSDSFARSFSSRCPAPLLSRGFHQMYGGPLLDKSRTDVHGSHGFVKISSRPSCFILYWIPTWPNLLAQ